MTYQNIIRNKSSEIAIEYGLVAALISVIAVAAMGALGTSLSNQFGTIATALGA